MQMIATDSIEFAISEEQLRFDLVAGVIETAKTGFLVYDFPHRETSASGFGSAFGC